MGVVYSVTRFSLTRLTGAQVDTEEGGPTKKATRNANAWRMFGGFREDRGRVPKRLNRVWVHGVLLSFPVATKIKGKWRGVVDMRWVNEQCVEDAHHLPRSD